MCEALGQIVIAEERLNADPAAGKKESERLLRPWLGCSKRGAIDPRVTLSFSLWQETQLNSDPAESWCCAVVPDGNGSRRDAPGEKGTNPQQERVQHRWRRHFLTGTHNQLVAPR